MDSINEPYKLIDLSNFSEKPLGFHFQLRQVLNMKKHREKYSAKRKHKEKIQHAIS